MLNEEPSKSLLILPIGPRRACTQRDGVVADLARTSSGLVSRAQPDVSQGVRRVVITDHVATLSQSTLKLPLLPFPWFLT